MLPHCTINGREIKFITAGKRFHDQKPLTEINLLGYGIIHPRVNIEELNTVYFINWVICNEGLKTNIFNQLSNILCFVYYEIILWSCNSKIK